ncbi:hypothetical protein HNR65_002144 [Desulfosalsimonas propionicica]|uniref:Uncharacterized protein n=1 Tax=Desulfosalsimonas propionicica TaxID=332175 RepID=A0A7W0C9V0_9BACT|nr:hypothetical protein [Desulfosalsimonas propionicica]MBA2881813.1 hypothetical protein [Desulfosalsimonas propionicica]
MKTRVITGVVRVVKVLFYKSKNIYRAYHARACVLMWRFTLTTLTTLD